MGAGLSSIAPSSPTVAISSYIDNLRDYEYVEIINNSRFLKTIKTLDNATENLSIVKVFIKPSNVNYSQNMERLAEMITREASLSVQLTSVLPWHRIIDTDRASYLIRQHIKTNLYDRISLMPFLEPIEKAFMAFQTIRALHDVHEILGLRHGDLKLENFLVTSSNWLLLTDFSSAIKPAYLPEDNPNKFSFYFDSSDRRICYIAPERFYNSKTDQERVKKSSQIPKGSDITKEMDIFSLGCVISELYSEGEPLFSLSQLFKYMKKEYEPQMSGVRNPFIRKLIFSLISLNPEERPSLDYVLKEYKDKCFPSYFYDFLYDYVSDLNRIKDDSADIPDYNSTMSDIRVNHIYDTFDQIVHALGFEYDTDYSADSDKDFVPLRLNIKGLPYNYTIRDHSSLPPDTSDDGALIILSVIFSLMRSLKRPSSKFKCCELIVALSERIKDECKLDRSLPYLCYLIDEYTDEITSANLLHTLSESSNSDKELHLSSRVVCTVLLSITTLLDSCNYINPINTMLFSEYLMPKFHKLNSVVSQVEDGECIKIMLAHCLPTLAKVHKKFRMISLNDKSKNGTNYLNDRFNRENSINDCNVAGEQFDSDFEKLASSLLTDPNPMVKISLVNNIFELCQYFGIDKTNDFILPHLITYLNDSNHQLRLAFLDSVLKIAPFVGVFSFEQYILPLLFRALADIEQLVVLKVLEIFTFVVRQRIINPTTEFNSLVTLKELIINSIPLVLHPNQWIRQSVITLIVSISDILSEADRFCLMYPLIKEYLSCDLISINWNSLYSSLAGPISKKMLEYIMQWSQGAQRSYFWAAAEKRYGLHDYSSSRKQDKFMAKSVYIHNLRKTPTLIKSELGNIPFSSEDKKWLLKLKTIGLEEKDLWKVYALRDYLVHIAKFASSANTELTLNANAVMVPRNVFFEIYYKSEFAAFSKNTETSYNATTPIESSESQSNHISEHNSLVLPNFSRPRISTQTVQANVFGEIDINVDHPINYHEPVNTMGGNDANSTSSFQKTVEGPSSKLITASMKHSYTGHNPFILKYLSGIKLRPTMDDFPQFGETVAVNNVKNSARWKPSGLSVFHINTRMISNITNPITALAVSPGSEFLITGSYSGSLDLWDPQRIMKSPTFKRPSLSLNLNVPILRIMFIQNKLAFVVSSSNGSLILLRIDVLRNKSNKITRFIKFTVITTFQLPFEDKNITSSDLFVTDSIPQIIYTSSNSKISCLNLIDFSRVYVLKNPLALGVLTSFALDRDRNWLVSATDRGYLSLWDLRFNLMVKTFRLRRDNQQEKEIGIKKLLSLNDVSFLPHAKENYSYIAIIHETNESDFSVWEVPTFECRAVFTLSNTTPSVIRYHLDEISKISDDFLAHTLSNLDINADMENASEHHVTSLCSYNIGEQVYVLSSTWDRKIVFWNLKNIEDSVVLNCPEYKFFKSQITDSLTVFYGIHTNATSSGRSDATKLENLALRQNDSMKFNQDIITAISVIEHPSNLLVSVDRNGGMNIFK